VRRRRVKGAATVEEQSTMDVTGRYKRWREIELMPQAGKSKGVKE